MAANHNLIRLIVRSMIVVALVLIAPGVNVSQVAYADASFVVNSTDDSVSSGSANGVCDNGSGVCTLREAVKEANAASGNKTITFSLGTATITLTQGMLVISADNITLDGGALSTITLSGAGLADGTSILRVQGGNNQILNLTVRASKWNGIQVGDFAGVGSGNYNLVSNVAVIGSVAAGIYVHGSAESGGNGNSISGSVIGAPNWSANMCVSWASNGLDGVYIDGGADDTLISGSRVVCSGGNGIYIDGGASGTNLRTIIATSDIGTNNMGMMHNFLSGIFDRLNTGTVIHDNRIGGNLYSGINLYGSSQTEIYGNTIGVTENSGYVIPNGTEGILVSDASHDVAVGSATDPSYRNIISGNTGSGVSIESGSYNIFLNGNLLGLHSNGTALIPNHLAGVAVFDSSAVVLSAIDATTQQFISGNTREGVYVQNSSAVSIYYNTYIGVAADTVTAKGNGREGILLVDSTLSSITSAKVDYNGLAGIAVTGNTSSGNYILPYEVRSNGGLPLDLGNDGHTPNDSGDGDTGPNGLLNYPVITTANGSNIGGTVCASCTVWIYEAFGNPAGNGGGGAYLTNTSADPSGNWNAALPGGLTAADVTLIAQGGGPNNVSEMSPIYVAGGGHRVYLPVVRR